MSNPYGQPPPPGGYGAPPGSPPGAGAPGGGQNPYGMSPYGAAPMAHRAVCLSCRQDVPTQHVTLRQNIGVVVMRFHKQISGNLCRKCIDKYFWEYTLITFFLGWWGVISFFFTLYILPSNLFTFIGSRKLPVSKAA